MKTKLFFLLLLITVIGCKIDNKSEESQEQAVESTALDGQEMTTGKGFKFTFNALVNKDDVFQLFYNEDGSESFDGDQMVEVSVKGNNQPQDIQFLLPDDASPLNVRFDIGSNPENKEIKLNQFSIEKGDKKFTSEGLPFFQFFYSNDQVECDTINSIAKNIGKKDAAYDPIIGGRLELRNELEKFFTQQ